MEDEKLAREDVAITVEEFTEDGMVYQRGDLRITAFTVDHGASASRCATRRAISARLSKLG